MVFELTQSLGLVLEHNKSEGFHFSRKHNEVNPDIDLGYAPFTGATPLRPGTIWRYLGFFFDRGLTFREHVKRYSNKSLTSVRAILALGNSVRGMRPKHKRQLYRACVLPIATYGSRLWLYEGAPMKGPLDSLRKMQRCACLWITGSFKTSPNGAAETLAGIPPIHLHLRKLVERSHVRSRTLQPTHAFRRLLDGDAPQSVDSLPPCTKAGLKSPVMEAWANLDLCSRDLDPVHPLATPGLRPKDLFPRRIVYDIPSPPLKKEDRKEFLDERREALTILADLSSGLPDHMCIISDALCPPLPLQSVAAWRTWHGGDLYEDWAAAGLSTSDDAELQALAGGVQQAGGCGLDGINAIHIFSDSVNALKSAFDATHHSGQTSSLPVCDLLVPWLQGNAQRSVHLHHVTKGVELVEHELVHLAATSIRVEAGASPLISASYARKDTVSRMLGSWKDSFRDKKYIGNNFLTLYESKDVPLVPTHLNQGPWMRKTGHSNTLTARLAHSVTGHAPIGEYRSRFFPLEPTSCRCGFPLESVRHVYRDCPLFERESRPGRQVRYQWLTTFLESNAGAFAFAVH